MNYPSSSPGNYGVSWKTPMMTLTHHISFNKNKFSLTLPNHSSIFNLKTNDYLFWPLCVFLSLLYSLYLFLVVRPFSNRVHPALLGHQVPAHPSCLAHKVSTLLPLRKEGGISSRQHEKKQHINEHWLTDVDVWLFLFSIVIKPDSSSSGGDGMYTMMKSVPGGAMPGVREISNLSPLFSLFLPSRK